MTMDDIAAPGVDIRESDVTASAHAARPLALSCALAEYDRTRPLIDGHVRPDGVDLTMTTGWIGDFCTRPVYEDYDVAEMSLSWYVAARCRGEPVIAIPVFPLRMAVLGYIYCRDDAPYTHPSQLAGKRIATKGYRYTVNLWLRGMLADHYGLAPEQVAWVTGESEGAGYVIPPGIDVTIDPDHEAGALLLSGAVDAVIGPEAPDAFRAGDPRIRRLFPDARAESADYRRRTGIYPITHTVVMKAELAQDEPWLAGRLVDAFRAAQRQCDAFYYDNAKHVSLPGAVFVLEEERRDYGPEPYSHGLDAENRKVIETFVRYAHEQGYIDRRPPVEDFFVPGSDAL